MDIAHFKHSWRAGGDAWLRRGYNASYISSSRGAHINYLTDRQQELRRILASAVEFLLPPTDQLVHVFDRRVRVSLSRSRYILR